MNNTAVHQPGVCNIDEAEFRLKHQRRALLITLPAFAIAAAVALVAYSIPIG